MARIDTPPPAVEEFPRERPRERGDARSEPGQQGRRRSVVGPGVTTLVLATLVAGRVLTLTGAGDLHLTDLPNVPGLSGLPGLSAGSATTAHPGVDGEPISAAMAGTSTAATTSASPSAVTPAATPAVTPSVAAPPAVVSMTCPAPTTIHGARATVVLGHQVSAVAPYRMDIDYGDGHHYTGSDANLGAVFSHTYVGAGTHVVHVSLAGAAGEAASASCTVVLRAAGSGEPAQ